MIPTFNFRVIDLQRQAEIALVDAKKQYLDLLKNEQGLQKQLLDLDKQRVSTNADFDSRKRELLGFTARPKTRSQQIENLEKDRTEALGALEERRTEIRTASAAERQKSIYQEQFGIVTDLKTFEYDINGKILEQENL